MKHDNFEGRVTRVNTGFDLDIIEGDTVLATGARRENSFFFASNTAPCLKMSPLGNDILFFLTSRCALYPSGMLLHYRHINSP